MSKVKLIENYLNKDESSQSTQLMRLSLLKRQGLKITTQRLQILKCLEDSKTPLSAPEIHELLKVKNRSNGESKALVPNKVSVYRVLERLSGLGVVHKVAGSGEYIICSHLSENNSYHIISHCLACRKYYEVELPTEEVKVIFSYLNGLKLKPIGKVLYVEVKCESCCN
jgi:Fe2+ or Zn2+ uptake regulation protein